MCVPLWILVCNPENRRKQFFTEALFAQYSIHPLIISYSSLLKGGVDAIMDVLKKRSVSKHTKIFVKIESPGESFSVEKYLIQLGCHQFSDRLSIEEAKKLSFDKGRFLYLKEWFFGYTILLDMLRCAFSEFEKDTGCKLIYLNAPEEILQMIDKYACQKQLQKHLITIPQLISAPPVFSDLLSILKESKIYQVFIKSRYGSSASGVMALRVNPKNKKIVARTTLTSNKQHPAKYYNSLKIKTYQKTEDIACLYNAIMAEDGYVERWIAKPCLHGLAFDLRVVVIAGKASHYVTRCSRSPISNLHLGNHRGDILQHPQGEKMLDAALQAAEGLVSVFPDSNCFGADILCSVAGEPRVIEVNAFGDLLPGILAQNLSTYDRQIIETVKRSVSGSSVSISSSGQL